MSAQDRGPAYILSLIAGALILLGGVVRAVTVGILPSRVYGSNFRFFSSMLQSPGIADGRAFNQAGAILAIASGIVVLVGAVMLSAHVEQYPAWGTLVLVFSAVGFLGGGGFLVGSLLGILGGIMAITWKPALRSIRP